jgi:hypothetical protein
VTTTSRPTSERLAIDDLAGVGIGTKISDENLEEFRLTILGDVLTPHDAGYATVRSAYNAMHPGKPALVVRPTGTADVIGAVNFAREYRLIVAVRGGGHCRGSRVSMVACSSSWPG